MTPYYEHAGVTIYHGDCREVLPRLAATDAVVTDPPFGIAWARATWADAAADYPALMRWLVGECERVVPCGWCFVFQAQKHVAQYHEWFPPGWRIFAACRNFTQLNLSPIAHGWDPVVFWRNGDAPGRQQRRDGVAVPRDYHVGNVAGVLGDHSEHPCPRPLDTMRHLVGLAVQEGGIVLDPFMGSGTTLRAAKDMGRRAVGIEIEERYCEIAAERLSQEVLPMNELGS